MRASDAEGREYLDRLLAGRLRLAVHPRHGAIERLPPSPSSRATTTPCVVTLEASLPVHRKLGDDRNVACYLGLLGTTALARR